MNFKITRSETTRDNEMSAMIQGSNADPRHSGETFGS